MVRFEWDPVKARTNFRKHGVSFDDAILVFDDPYTQLELDGAGNRGEVRWRALGLAGGLVVLVVVHTIRGVGQDEIIRLISARRATRMERNRYDETCSQDLS
jgi:hypothetical protein